MVKRRETAWDEHNKPVPPDHAYALRLSDLKAAFKSVGNTPIQRLSWITRFVSEDPTTWQSTTRAAHGNCILALTGYAFPPFLHGGVTLPTPLPPEDIDEVHRELSRALRQFVNMPAGETVFFAPDGKPLESDVHLGIARFSDVHKKPAVWVGVTRFKSPRAALYVLRELLLRAGERVIACRWCGAPVVAVRKQEFCNTKCAMKARNDRRPSKASVSKQQGRKNRA
jgi:hypothetical protein